ncbi:MAG: hypothetical protein SWN10_01855 [Pseudomonadota bacterium]|nr:hypothetical protein [Pseudomonadota bacterium]
MRKLLFALALVNSSSIAADAHYEEWTAAGGKINWTTAQVSAEGYGLPPGNVGGKAGPLLACRAAVVDAQRNLLEATQGVRVTATTVIDNYMLSNDEVKSEVEGIIRNARIISRTPANDGSCKIEMVINLGGKASKTIYQEVYQETGLQSFYRSTLDWLGGAVISKAYAQDDVELEQPAWLQEMEKLNRRLSVIEQKLVENRRQEAQPGPAADVQPTGLVVDARGSNFIPSLSPKIRQLRGAVVYPDQGASNERLLERGQLVSLFARDVDFAVQHPVVGNRPLLVKALRTYGDTRTEIVLASEYAERIIELNDKGFFNEAGVIIVLD